MRQKTISFCYGVETKVHEVMTNLRKKCWYESDINNIRQKLELCGEGVPLTPTQKSDIISYWKKLTGKKVPIFWHQYFYTRNGKYSERYVPTCLYHSDIIWRLNNRQLAMAYTDKCQYDNYFHDVFSLNYS